MQAVPTSRDVVVRYLLEHNCQQRPDSVIATFEDGTVWTNREALRQAYAAANVLRAAGVRQGDKVAILLRNGQGFLRGWWGSACLGATMVAINVAYRGTMLDHVFELTEPTVIITEGEFVERVENALRPPLILAAADLVADDASAPPLDRPIEGWDTQCITMTSGTTGPSKASMTSYQQLYMTGSFYTVGVGLREGDTGLIDLPLFHQAGLSMCTSILHTGARVAIRSAPDLKNYWHIVKETGASIAFLISTMMSYLLAQEPGPHERDHQLRYLVLSPPPVDAENVLKRFGISDYVTGYGMTELSGCIARLPGVATAAGSIGRVRPGYELRLVDSFDVEVTAGAIGELIVRTDDPWWISAGYVKNPAATAASWRNGWFHTGDLMRRDADGNYFFHDRVKDAVRHRGENVSSFEVEREVAAHPTVAEVACVPHAEPGEIDQEVKVWLVAAENSSVDFGALLEFLVPRMPHFMVPRFYELTDSLPKTESMRVKKGLLRDRGNSTDTWDVLAHGYRVGRNGLVRTVKT